MNSGALLYGIEVFGSAFPLWHNPKRGTDHENGQEGVDSNRPLPPQRNKIQPSIHLPEKTPALDALKKSLLHQASPETIDHP